MDDSCAVCAETLEWVAYGRCGHKDVCSTCVSRLRFICDDRRCCICKTESDVVFVTKALGDYTTRITDFSNFPSQPKEGKISQSYWYHEDTQAFFDDLDHYTMIKSMCNLSCSVCEKIEGNPQRRLRFRNINQLKGHLFHEHKLLFCSLCLEGRKVFICEQKLYTRLELNQHISNGDSVVDGDEFERGGFSGHPMCEFCKSHFYGDSDLYTHMSTEHFTCHICQRQHPGQYEYYANYDDLESHFRHGHFLCEVEACLEKKFIVFQSEAELKRHNALEHGGNMSRSKRSAALQIPVSFSFRRSNERDSRRERSGSSNHDFESSSSDSYPTLSNPQDSFPSLSGSSGSSSVSGPTPTQSRSSTLYSDLFPSISATYQRQTHNQRNQRRSNNQSRSNNQRIERQISELDNRIASLTLEAKKSLVKSIQKELDNDPCRFTSFKNICKDYRDGALDAVAYLDYIKRFGLSRFVPEIAKTCPDVQKQQALLDAYNASLRGSRNNKEKLLSWGSDARESNGRKPTVGGNPWRSGGGKNIIASDSRGKNKRI